jgi:hypothetical protein
LRAPAIFVCPGRQRGNATTTILKRVGARWLTSVLENEALE